MIPILSTSYPLTGNGLGGLSDAIMCKVTHEVNGIYEMSMQYPVTGNHYSEIQNNQIIMATPDYMTTAQPFRIYRITRPLNGVVTIYARHITYDMSGIIITPFTSSTLTTAISDVPTYALPGMQGFSLATTKTVASQMKIDEPRTLWKLLGGEQGSFLDVYGGEWDFDGMTATLRTRLGADRGVEIQYAKNLTQLEADQDLSSTYGGVFPYWYSEEEGYVAPSAAVMITGSPYTRILLLDCSETFETKPTVLQLQVKANQYIVANSVGDPKQSWKVNFAMLSQSPEYANTLDSVMLGDTVKVIYEDLGVNATARIVKTEWDVLNEKYISATVGRVKQNLASIIVGQNREVESQIKTTRSDLETAIANSTDFIKNGGGYMRLIYDSNDEITEIVSLDNPDIAQAAKVWRWNNGGFGFSSTGYNGTYGLAITQNGEIVADYITTGTLNAARVQTGILSDALSHNSWNLDTGALTITDGSINITTTSQLVDKIILNYSSVAGTWTTKMSPYLFDMAYSDASDASETSLNAGALSLSKTDADGTHTGTFNYTSWGLASPVNGRIYADAQGNLPGITYPLLGIIDTSMNWRMRIDQDALTFFNSSGTQTAIYPADPSTLLSANNLRTVSLSDNTMTNYSSSGTSTYTLVNDATYLVTYMRRNSTSTTNNGAWIVSTQGASNISTILTPGSGTSATISGTTLTVVRGSSYGRVTITRLS